ncbi:MAG: hypothetical protein N3C13_00215, partial [Aquificaceae bacterium]|nr:hypothetical protein [Aquificaceae bacterium]
MLQIRERNPFSSLVLEVLDDPSKKEVLFYLLCYSQLVRREGSSHVELDRFLSCAYRNFKNARHHWKDVLVEMNLFVVSDLYGNVYTGKDIYKVGEGELYLISLRRECLPLLESISYKAVKLWNILSRVMVYRRHISAQDALTVATLMFNEGLYEELKGYCELCAERYPAESLYFGALRRLSNVYAPEEQRPSQELWSALRQLEKLSPVYYGINILKLRRDVEYLLGRVEKGKSPEALKVEFINQKIRGEGWLRRFLKKVKSLLRRPVSYTHL